MCLGVARRIWALMRPEGASVSGCCSMYLGVAGSSYTSATRRRRRRISKATGCSRLRATRSRLSRVESVQFLSRLVLETVFDVRVEPEREDRTLVPEQHLNGLRVGTCRDEARGVAQMQSR